MPDRHRTRRRTIRPEAPELIDLAAGLRDAVVISESKAARLTSYLFLAVPEWRARAGDNKGWLFHSPATLDLYEVAGSNDPALEERMATIARGLFVRGFAMVRLHHHDQHRKPIGCVCKERIL